MSDSEFAIELKNVHKSFRGARDQILKGINLKFKKGKLTYILGPSGTGKSVTIKHILGLLLPDTGEIWVHGKNIANMKADALAVHRTQFGMLFQNAALFDDFTIFENVAFPLIEHTEMTKDQITKKVEQTLAHLGITTGLDKYPNELSGGMRKRVGLARAIVREPQILLYDEPTTGLDPVTRVTVDELIAQMKHELKLTSVVISHDIPSALSLADEIAFLFEGNVVFQGTPAEFRKAEHPRIKQFLEAEMKSVRAVMQ